jgi:hypothetical protein
MTKIIPAIEKLDGAHVENAAKAAEPIQREEVAVREFDPKFMRKTMLKVYRLCCLLVNNALTSVVGLDHYASINFNLSLFVARQE